MTSEYADVSCGDAHKFGSKKSLIISRNERTTKLIKLAEELEADDGKEESVSQAETDELS